MTERTIKSINTKDFFSQLESEREQEYNNLDLKINDFVVHPNLGKGKVVKIKVAKKINDAYIDIDFEVHGVKRVLFIFAQLKKL